MLPPLSAGPARTPSPQEEACNEAYADEPRPSAAPQRAAGAAASVRPAAGWGWSGAEPSAKRGGAATLPQQAGADAARHRAPLRGLPLPAPSGDWDEGDDWTAGLFEDCDGDAATTAPAAGGAPRGSGGGAGGSRWGPAAAAEASARPRSVGGWDDVGGDWETAAAAAPARGWSREAAAVPPGGDARRVGEAASSRWGAGDWAAGSAGVKPPPPAPAQRGGAAAAAAARGSGGGGGSSKPWWSEYL